MKSSINAGHKSVQAFHALKGLLISYEKDLKVVIDQPDTYYVDVPGNIHTPGYFFGAVQLRTDYVTFHFAGLPGIGELLTSSDGGLCIVQNGDKNSFLAFKTVSKVQLQKLKHLLDIYSDPYCLSCSKDQ